MIDEALITPSGEVVTGWYDRVACLYTVQRGLWTACGYDEDRKAVQLDWGGVERPPSPGFALPSNETADAYAMRSRGRGDYEFNLLDLIESDYVSTIEGTKWRERMERGAQFTQHQRDCIDRWRAEGMPVPWIEARLQTGNQAGVRYLASFIACRTVQTRESREMLQEAYRQGHSELEISKRCGLSRRLVNWVIHEWGK